MMSEHEFHQLQKILPKLNEQQRRQLLNSLMENSSARHLRYPTRNGAALLTDAELDALNGLFS
ncbi:hypothetical protein [Thaumasiovibrio subtropicus]|uniref:hypothetical protein n=1 Tax=Thaumasiovibrio subtropicus TaxID=1891207 RepID=UPI00131D849B|nr:hypothetical protein [Thaumasiovibrio subtropicus]